VRGRRWNISVLVRILNLNYWFRNYPKLIIY
jgi:hypothetical protein